MKRCITIITLLLMTILIISGCNRKKYDKVQVYHAEYTELEHYINDELGDYLSIENYQEPSDENGLLVINVYLRSSYYDDQAKISQTPMWLIIDRFRCCFNEYISQHPDYFGDEVERYKLYFWVDDGATVDYVSQMANYVEVPDAYNNSFSLEIYDIIVSEDIHADYHQLSNKEDLICLFIGYNYNENEDSPSLDQCIDYFCDCIEQYPNLRYFRITSAPLPISDWERVEEGIVNRIGAVSAV